MNCRFFLLATALGFLFVSSGTGQESAYIPYDEQSLWGNPYPGLGNVSPGSAGYYTSEPQNITLYGNQYTNFSELTPTVNSNELYRSRFPNNKRTGVFQKIDFNTLWAPRSGNNGLGMTELDLSAMFALPMPTAESPLLITPKFATTFFDLQGGNETFYTTGLGLRWIRPLIKDKLTADLGVGVYYSGDFKADGSETIRVPAHLAGIWDFNPRTKIVFGVVYSDRLDNYSIFPMAGLIWTPNDDVSVELLIPRMRVAQRIRWFGSAAGEEQSDWLYTAFEFGNGSWGLQGIDGRIEYSDLRLALGYERRTRYGLTLGLEVGCMLDRKLTLEGIGSGYPSESVFLRVRSSF